MSESALMKKRATSQVLASSPIYEQPLNERIRNLLRLERLFIRLKHHSKGKNAWDTHIALQIVLDIAAIIGRWDVKSDVIKELERQLQNLRGWKSAPGIDLGTLNRKLHQHEAQIEKLYDQGFNITKALNQEFINTVKHRSSIAPDICSFDMPSYHYWLNLDHPSRIQLLEDCTRPMLILGQSIQLALDGIRQSSEMQPMKAQDGFYQQNLASKTTQLIRVSFDSSDAQVFPEISAGKHRFSIRFLNFTTPLKRPEPVDKDVSFLLACCTL